MAGGAPRTDESVDEGPVGLFLDGIVLRLVPGVFTIAGAILAGLALVDLFAHAAPMNVALAVSNGVAAAAFLVAAHLARTSRLPAARAQTAFLVVDAVAFAPLVLGAVATPGAHNAFILALVAVGGSAILLSWRHYVALSGLVVGAALTLGRAGLLDGSLYVDAVVVACAVGLGAVVHFSRLQGHRQLARLTLAERARRESLELAYAALGESEQRFERVLSSIPEAFWIHENAAGRVVYASPAFEAIWGIPRASLYANEGSWERSLHADDRARAMDAVARVNRLDDEEIDHEYRIVRPDGGVRWIRDRVFIVRDAAGKPRGTAGIAEDVTLKREVEATLRRSERLSTLGTLVAGVAHEVNNPLTFISANAQLTEESLDAALAREDVPADVRAALAEARDGNRVTREGIARIAGITQSLKRVARAGSSARAIEDPNALVESALAVARPRVREGVAIEHDLRAKRHVRASATELSQVLLNLMLNAIDAVDGRGGKIRVSTRDERDRIVIEVADSGPGIPPDVQARLFTPFFTTKAHGTGLGLSIAHGIVTEHGGEITLDSTPGAGTTFRVLLPAVVE